MMSVLYFIPDIELLPIMRTVQEAISPGSYVAMSYDIIDGLDNEETSRVLDLYRTSGYPLFARTHAELSVCFEGLELVSPGLVTLDQ